MKHITISFIILSFLFLSCKQKINYSEDIQGKWLCQEIKEIESKPFIIPTNDAFTVQFNADANLKLSKGYAFNLKDKLWVEKNFTYTIEKEKLLITGKNALDEQVELSLTIEQLTSMAMTCKEIYYKVNNEEKEAGRTFYFTKIYKNYEKEILGKWEVSNTAKPDTFAFAKYVFLENNKLNIYELENDELQYETEYFLNGELLSINYSIDSDNHNYRCWLIQSFSKDLILIRNWQAMPSSHDLQGTTYKLKKN